jgi:hypothetical protein
MMGACSSASKRSAHSSGRCVRRGNRKVQIGGLAGVARRAGAEHSDFPNRWKSRERVTQRQKVFVAKSNGVHEFNVCFSLCESLFTHMSLYTISRFLRIALVQALLILRSDLKPDR